MPMWPGATLTKTKTTKTPQGKSYTADFSTPDPYADVLAGVGEGLKRAGFKVTATDASTGPVKVALLVIADKKFQGVVTLSKMPNEPVTIEYTITPKR
jgi:hypothetical protein